MCVNICTCTCTCNLAIVYVHVQDGVSDKPFIKNKMAQIIALTFVNDYPAKVSFNILINPKSHPLFPYLSPSLSVCLSVCLSLSLSVSLCLSQWPSFFMDILSIIEHDASIWTVDLYLRILLAIDDEIVDREVVHTQEVIIHVYNNQSFLSFYTTSTCVNNNKK